jgi:hypothetical protein
MQKTTVVPASGGVSGEQVGPLFLSLFGLPFLLAGLFVLYLGISEFLDNRRAGTWDEVPAEILAIELKTSSGSKGGTTYRIDGQFQYTFGGKSFTSRRMVSSSGFSSDREYWQNLYDQANSAKQSGKTLPARVNPGNPSEALLFREFSTMSLALIPFGLVFALVGGGLGFAGLYSSWAASRHGAALKNNPQRPWRAEPEWQGFHIRSGSWKKILVTWVFGLGLSLFLSVFVLAMSTDPSLPLIPKLIVGLFLLIGLGILGHAVYLTLQHLKYGSSTLLLSQMPLVPGMEFTGVVLVKRHLMTEGGTKATLKCVRTNITGSGKQRKSVDEDILTKAIVISRDLVQPGSGRSALPLKFEIPAAYPPTDREDNPKITWKLTLEAETPGIDFWAEFELPVFKVASPDLIEYREPRAGEQA